jgi:hypothetical protein
MMLSARGHARTLTLRARSCACGAESIILSEGGAESMMLLAPFESIILSEPPAESMILSERTESIILSAPPAENMMLTA